MTETVTAVHRAHMPASGSGKVVYDVRERLLLNVGAVPGAGVVV